MKWKVNERARQENQKTSAEFLNQEVVKQVMQFHKSVDNYAPTPLWSLNNLAEHLGVEQIFVKDESYRFGLNAFKVLGGSYAMGRYLAKCLELPLEGLSFNYLKSAEIRSRLGDITFTTATDGNHGRGVAWAAQQLGQKAVVYMPAGSAQRRLENIKATGAEAYITDLNYDDAVRFALQKAQELGWVMVQDTAWDGYEEIPTWIMQGYATMASEALEQMKGEKPTHIFIQAGVGALAGAMVGFFASAFPDDPPIAVIVEPDKADCLYRSALEGKIKNVGGDMNTIMAGLACGEPNPIGWNILYDYANAFISCPDNLSARGMRILGNPLGTDPRIISGESGAIGIGVLSEIMQDTALGKLRESLKLNKDSKILFFSTEGDTDPDKYRSIVWDGEFESFKKEGKINAQ
ncbi:MAG: diaminopropionate ammonia-lyase [Bacillota bacterium]|nr:diaminopropionate ammonia-lyase [Bacillota bacterium]